jgi:hypothetical protein
MANTYSITAADLVSGLIPQAEYDRCLANPGGDEPATLDGVVGQAEGDIHSRAGAAPVGTLAITIFRTQVLTCTLYWLHARRAQQDNGKIPEHVKSAYDAVIAWATDAGRNLIAAEGMTAAGGGISAATLDFDPQEGL